MTRNKHYGYLTFRSGKAIKTYVSCQSKLCKSKQPPCSTAMKLHAECPQSLTDNYGVSILKKPDKQNISPVPSISIIYLT